MNKGKDDIANVEATVVGDSVDTPARTQYLGNITAGSSGNIGFALTPTQEGEVDLVLKISYENANQQLQTREFPLTLQVEEPVLDDSARGPPHGRGRLLPLAVGGCLGGGAAVLAAGRSGPDAGAEAQKGGLPWTVPRTGTTGKRRGLRQPSERRNKP